jgi:hypothetical protein
MVFTDVDKVCDLSSVKPGFGFGNRAVLYPRPGVLHQFEKPRIVLHRHLRV